MEVNKLTIRRRVLTGLLSGIAFASLMAGYDYFTDTPFSILKFLFHFMFFGLFMGIAVKYSAKKSNK